MPKAKRKRNAKNRYVMGVDGRSFVKTRLTRDGSIMTIWIEGRDQDGPSVAGIGLSIDALRKHVTRLQNSLRSMEHQTKRSA